jgi:hypothetical protein
VKSCDYVGAADILELLGIIFFDASWFSLLNLIYSDILFELIDLSSFILCSGYILLRLTWDIDVLLETDTEPEFLSTWS